MSPALRWLVPVVLVTVLVTLLSCFLSPYWLVAADLQKLETARQRRRELERIARVTWWRVQAKILVVEEVVQGRLTLLEAAAWFHWLNANPPHLPFREKMPGQESLEERCCQAVITYTRLHERAAAGNSGDSVADRLEDDFRFWQASPGGLVLPAPPERVEVPPWPEMG